MECQNIVGMHGLGRGERLIQFCQENKLIIAIRGSNNQLENYTHGKVLETYQEVK